LNLSKELGSLLEFLSVDVLENEFEVISKGLKVGEHSNLKEVLDVGRSKVCNVVDLGQKVFEEVLSRGPWPP